MPAKSSPCHACNATGNTPGGAECGACDGTGTFVVVESPLAKDGVVARYRARIAELEAALLPLAKMHLRFPKRSEERRVGKEC